MINVCLELPFRDVYCVKKDCGELVSSLRVKYGRYAVDGIGAEPRREKHNITAMKNGERFTVRTPEGERETGHPMYEIERYMFIHPCFDDSVFALHGAAVEAGGKAWLFLASTTTGKTTLASYLTYRGCGYITDDCILLDRESFLVNPFSAPIHLRRGGLDVLTRCGAQPDNYTVVGDIPEERFVFTPGNCTSKALPLGGIFFIRRTESENRVCAMTATERMTALMRSPITVYRVDGEYLRFITRLASAGNCRTLTYCDMDFVYDTIRGERQDG